MKTTYQGGCHCGKVRFEAAVDLTKPALMCNCSICSKRGYVLAFVPGNDFKLVSGEEALTDYLFNKKAIHHLFCSTCGVGAFGRGVGPDGGETFAVNVRCLDGVELERVPTVPYDGKSR